MAEYLSSGTLSAAYAPVIASLAAFAACLYLVLFRLWLGPLAKYPGPKLAALSQGYQFWFDVVKKGKLPWELIRLHDSYGKFTARTSLIGAH